MKKIIVTVTLFVSFGFALTAQMVNITQYALLCAESYGIPDWKWNNNPLTVPVEALNAQYGGLGGKSLTAFDTPLELALYAYYTGNVPDAAEALLPHSDPKVSGLKLGAATLKELTELKFLDPQNTAAMVRYEGMLKFISDKNGVSRAEIDTYYRQGIAGLIAGAVDEFFNATYSGYTPAIVYAEWKQKGVAGGVDAIALVKEAITNFYASPTRDNYAALTGIHARYWLNAGLISESFTFAAREAFYRTLAALSPVLAERVSGDVRNNASVLARTPSDFRYNVFSTRGAQR